MSDTEANKALVRRFVEQVQNGKDLDLMPELCTADYTLHHPAMPEPIRGLPKTREIVAGIFREYPDMRFTIEEIVAEGDRVATRILVQGTNLGPVRGAAEATNKIFTGTGIVTYRIVDGKIAEAKIQEDILHMLHLLGLVPRSQRLLYWLNKLGIIKILQKAGKVPGGASAAPGRSAGHTVGN